MRYIYNFVVFKDGQVQAAEEKLSLEATKVWDTVCNLADVLIEQGFTGVIFVEQILYHQNEQQTKVHCPQFTKEYGERKTR